MGSTKMKPDMEIESLLVETEFLVAEYAHIMKETMMLVAEYKVLLHKKQELEQQLAQQLSNPLDRENI